MDDMYNFKKLSKAEQKRQQDLIFESDFFKEWLKKQPKKVQDAFKDSKRK